MEAGRKKGKIQIPEQLPTKFSTETVDMFSLDRDPRIIAAQNRNHIRSDD
ncbi:hypothetical protein C8N32_107108 [Rhodovulum imhoffii]|uniref:Uncharacterized protein n=1 Tax=Rhodovulum imhoffii TaxID=365340 RepID=A0A2T5BSM8_9RHOB|nr:hypothetical protein C8N32_107108 [Rhodovulum imhoffii]